MPGGFINGGFNIGRIIFPAQSSSASPWTPAELTTTAWFDADDAATITHSGGSVSQWDDKSGNGFDLAQGSASLQPETGTVTIGGLNALRFDQDSMANLAFALTGTTVAAFAVMELDAASDNFGRVIGAANDAADWNDTEGFTLARNGTNESMVLYRAQNATSGAAVTYSTPFLAAGIFDGSTKSLFIDGANGASNASSGSFNSTELRLGSGVSASSDNLEGKIAEVVLVTDVTETTRQLVEGYLAHKWGTTASLPAAHPYKSSAPTV